MLRILALVLASAATVWVLYVGVGASLQTSEGGRDGVLALAILLSAFAAVAAAVGAFRRAAAGNLLRAGQLAVTGTVLFTASLGTYWLLFGR